MASIPASLTVGVGGFVGSVARLLVGGYVTQQLGAPSFPAGTLAVNLIGCLVIGLLSGMLEVVNFLSADARLLLFTGVLGGFTTFSAFGLDSVFLLRRGEIFLAVAYVLANVLGGIVLVWAGIRLATIVASR